MSTTKSDIVATVASKTDLSKAAAARAVDAALEAIGSSLTAGNDVTITGFGTFSVKQRPAREGRNPATGAALHIEASNGVHFKPSKNLKDSLN